MTAGMDRRARQMQHLRATLGVVRHELQVLLGLLADAPPPTPAQPPTEHTNPVLDAQGRPLLRWLDDTPA
jgi:hypothetical protein